MHLLFPYETSLGEAHRQATLLERRLIEELRTPAEVITHLESLEDHAEVHRSA
jgi:divalent metal cation (Fe/Co/Zn/Cd) transporter